MTRQKRREAAVEAAVGIVGGPAFLSVVLVRLENAVARVIAEGRDVTYDMKPDRADPTAVGTSQVADAIIRQMTN